MLHKLFFCACLLLNISPTFAQITNLSVKTIGGSAADKLKAVIPNSDGSYIVGGTTNSNDVNIIQKNALEDILVMKLDENHTTIWSKCFGGDGTDRLEYMQKTNDGGYIIAGTTNSVNGDITYFSGAGSNLSYYDVWVFKINANGDLQWQKSFPSGPYNTNFHTFNDKYSFGVKELSNGTFVVGVYETSFLSIFSLSTRSVLKKLDANGIYTGQTVLEVWGETPKCNIVSYIDVNEQDEIIACGNADSIELVGGYQFGRENNTFVAKYTLNGTRISFTEFGDLGKNEYVYKLRKVSNGYITLGYRYIPNDNSVNFYAGYVGLSGNLIWKRGYGNIGLDQFTDGIEEADGTFTFIGNTRFNNTFNNHFVNTNDIILTRINQNTGSFISASNICIGGNSDDYAYNIEKDNNGKYFLAGETKSFDGDISNFLGVNDGIIINANLSTTTGINPSIDDNIIIKPYSTYVEIVNNATTATTAHIYDIQGRLLQSYPISSSITTINLTSFAKGLYVMNIDIDGARISKKISIN